MYALFLNNHQVAVVKKSWYLNVETRKIIEMSHRFIASNLNQPEPVIEWREL